MCMCVCVRGVCVACVRYVLYGVCLSDNAKPPRQTRLREPREPQSSGVGASKDWRTARHVDRVATSAGPRPRPPRHPSSPARPAPGGPGGAARAASRRHTGARTPGPHGQGTRLSRCRWARGRFAQPASRPAGPAGTGRGQWAAAKAVKCLGGPSLGRRQPVELFVARRRDRHGCVPTRASAREAGGPSDAAA